MRLILALFLLAPCFLNAGQSVFDFDALNSEAKTHLMNLIDINTAQPDPNETAAVRYIYKHLNKQNIDWDIYRAEKARGNLITTLKGGKEKPLILIAHLDTAAVQDGWTMPPTKAVLKNNRIYGLGSTDAKNYAAIYLTVLTWLKNNNIKLNRDITFIFTADEENGSAKGIKFLLDKYPQKIKAGFALNEGGGLILSEPPLKNIMFVEAASKMYMDILVTAKGDGAHSSIPTHTNAIYKLSEALSIIDAYKPAARLTPFTKTFLQKIAETQDADAQTTISLLNSPDPVQSRQATDIISEDSFFKTQLTDTITPTILSAGTESNTLSAEAMATLNCRLLPSTSPSAFFDDLSNLFAHDEAVTLTLIETPEMPFPQPPQTSDDPLFMTIEKSVNEVFPNTITVAGMTPASTESEFLRRSGITAYGLGPVMDPASEPHVTDENIGEQDFYSQLRLIFNIVLNFATDIKPPAVPVVAEPAPLDLIAQEAKTETTDENKALQVIIDEQNSEENTDPAI